MRPLQKTLACLLVFVITSLAGCNDTRVDASRSKDDSFSEPSALPVPDANGPTPTPASEPTPAPTPSPEPVPADFPRACHPIYAADTLPTFDLRIADDVWDELEDDFGDGLEIWRPAALRYGDEEYPDVMVRMRGNFSSCGGKMQFAFAFHQVNPEGRFHGLKRLNLDHAGCRVLFERVAMEFVREELNIPAPCVNNARFLINGEFYGLFANVEHQNKDFLKRNFSDADGNLYKAAKVKKTNEDDPDQSDLDALLSADTLEAIEAVVDLDQAIRMWAAEAILPAEDNYWFYDRNYYVYNHAGRGFLYLPNDYDRALPLYRNWYWDPYSPQQRIAETVLEDSGRGIQFEEELRDIHSRFRPAWFEERLDRYWTQVKDDVEMDPFLDLNDEDIVKLKDTIRQRKQFLDERFE